MSKLFKVLFLLLSGFLYSQNPEYKIVVTYNLYATGFEGDEYLYSKNKIDVTSSKKTNQLIQELNLNKSIDDVFKEIGIDTLKILNNPKSLIKLYKNDRIKWNKQQIEYITEKLRDLDTYKNNFSKHLSAGCCVFMNHRYRDEYVIDIFFQEQLVNSFASRKSLPNSRKIPWIGNQNEENYNYEIDKILFDIIGNQKSFRKLPSKSNLTKDLVSEIIDYHKPILYDLSAYDYLQELNELKTDFEILEIGEVYAGGWYIRNENKTYYARLKNSLMLPQVNMIFYSEKKRSTIYSRDSLKADYKNILSRVQEIEFLTNYLKQNLNVSLDIYYFNNKPINDYNIENFNSNPKKWIKHDQFLERNIKYENIEPKPSYADAEAIRFSQDFYCGCNFRFDRKFVEKAIFIELNNKETKENSIWHLLPDNTVLLYGMQGEKVLDYNYKDFGKFKGIQYPCVLFDLNGNIIDRK